MRSFASAFSVSVTIAAFAAALSGTFHAQARQPAPASKLRFDASYIPQIHDGPLTGRAFVMITRSIDKVAEPRLQIGRTGVPFFGRDVERLEPEKIVSYDPAFPTYVGRLKGRPHFVQHTDSRLIDRGDRSTLTSNEG
jgi:hypothetical protein